MSKSKIVFYVLAGCLVLAGCQTNKSSNSGNSLTSNLQPASNAGSIDGRWVPTDTASRAVYYNEFRAGKFVSRSPDGKKTIAAGTYTASDNGDIQMKWYSEARKANASATCKKLSEQEMQCTSGASVFNLQRA